MSKHWMKKFLIALAAAVLMLGISSALGEFAVVSNTSSLNLREGPGYAYEIIGTVARSEWVQVDGESDGFYAVTLVKNGRTGYVDSNYLSFGSSSSASGTTGVVNNPKSTSFLNLREYPSYSANVLGIYYNGAECEIISSYNGWYEVEIDGMIGYFRYEYIKIKGSVGKATVVSSNGKNVNLRSGPSTSYSSIKSVQPGTSVNILLKGNNFWKISVNGTVGYMASAYLSTSGGSSDGGSVTPTTSGYVVVNNPNTSALLNLREQPSSSAKILAQYPNGTRFEVIAQGETWCKVYGTASKRTGYMMTKYLKLYGLPGVPSKTVQNGSSYVNLRTMPSKDTGSVIARISSGSTVTVLTPGDEWTQVRYGKLTGYMMTYFLK